VTVVGIAVNYDLFQVKRGKEGYYCPKGCSWGKLPWSFLLTVITVLLTYIPCWSQVYVVTVWLPNTGLLPTGIQWPDWESHCFTKHYFLNLCCSTTASRNFLHFLIPAVNYFWMQSLKSPFPHLPNHTKNQTPHFKFTCISVHLFIAKKTRILCLVTEQKKKKMTTWC